MAINLTTAATVAAQHLRAITSGQSISPVQVTDMFGIANRMLQSWVTEEQQTLTVMISDHAAGLSEMLAQNNLEFESILAGYTLSGGTYTPGSVTDDTYTPGSGYQFADTVTNLTLPPAYERAVVLSLAIESASYWNKQAPQDLVRQATEARAAASPVPRRQPIPGTAGQGLIPPPPDPRMPVPMELTPARR